MSEDIKQILSFTIIALILSLASYFIAGKDAVDPWSLTDEERREIQSKLAPATVMSEDERNEIQRSLSASSTLSESERHEIQNRLRANSL